MTGLVRCPGIGNGLAPSERGSHVPRTFARPASARVCESTDLMEAQQPGDLGNLQIRFGQIRGGDFPAELIENFAVGCSFLRKTAGEGPLAQAQSGCHFPARDLRVRQQRSNHILDACAQLADVGRVPRQSRFAGFLHQFAQIRVGTDERKCVDARFKHEFVSRAVILDLGAEEPPHG